MLAMLFWVLAALAVVGALAIVGGCTYWPAADFSSEVRAGVDTRKSSPARKWRARGRIEQTLLDEGRGLHPNRPKTFARNRTLPQEAPDVSICDKGQNTSKDTPDLEGDTGVLLGAVIRKGRRRRHPRRPLRFPQGGRRVTQRSPRCPARAQILPTDRSLSRCARAPLPSRAAESALRVSGALLPGSLLPGA